MTPKEIEDCRFVATHVSRYALTEGTWVRRHRGRLTHGSHAAK
jgi:hypothetical protein